MCFVYRKKLARMARILGNLVTENSFLKNSNYYSKRKWTSKLQLQTLCLLFSHKIQKNQKHFFDLKLHNRSDTLGNNVGCDVVFQGEAIHKICKE